ncbi:MAG: metallophosphoesterase [Candidatus Cloacimonetes bacterium]|nr:metallophosphoesterase [Candidatus Cloacimonadota bacterium]
MYFLLALTLSSSLFAYTPNDKLMPKANFETVSETRGIQFYKSEPKITLSDDQDLNISIETLQDTHPGVLYFGHIHPNQNFPYPRLRYKLKEKSKNIDKVHTFKFNFDPKAYYSPEKTKYDAAKYAKSGGIVPLQFEFYNPKKQSNDIYQTSFRYFKNAQKKRSLQSNILLGPFYDTHKAGQIIISFDLDFASEGKITLQERDKKEFRVIPFEKAKYHEIVIDVKQATKYSYQVHLPNIEKSKIVSWYDYPKLNIKTSSNKFTPFSFACMSDSRSGLGGGEFELQGTNTDSIKNLFRRAYDRGADLIVFPGDLIDGYTTAISDFNQQIAAWKKAATPVGRLIPIFEGMGNHEALIGRFKAKDPKTAPKAKWGSFSVPHPEISTEALFAKHFVNPTNGPDSEGKNTPTYKENVYSYTYNGAGFIMLNTNYWYTSDPEVLKGGNLEGHIMETQLKWLKDTVQNFHNDKSIKYIFVFAHEPSFPNSVHWTDGMYYGAGKKEFNSGFDRSYINAMRNNFWGSISSSNKTVFAMFGDEHNYSRTLVPANKKLGFENDVWQMISGGVGAPYYYQVKNLPWSKDVKKFDWKQHFLLVNINEGGVFLSAVSSTGELIDVAKIK